MLYNKHFVYLEIGMQNAQREVLQETVARANFVL